MAGAKERYDDLVGRKSTVLLRGRENAKLSLPSVLPEEGHNQTTRLIEPYQGIAGDGTVNLSNKLLMTLFPSGQPFFRFDLSPQMRLQVMQQKQGQEDLNIQRGFALSEEIIMSEIEAHNWRSATTQTLQQLIVAGNAMEYLAPDNNIKVFRLDQFVVVRDYIGNLLEAVIHEKIAPEALPEEARPLAANINTTHADHKVVDVYTHIIRETDKWRVYQEINGQLVPKSDGTYKLDELPYFAYRWGEIPGEDYGRSKMEEHIGDIRSLEALEKSSLELVAMLARNFIMIKPNASGGNIRRRIAQARNGDVVVGDWDQVKMMVFENAARNLQATEAKITEKRQALGRAFLMFSAVTRDAERVTAEEIKLQADELDGALGGVYSTLSREMMAARLRRLIVQMQESNKLPAWESSDVQPIILTGLEALGRQRDVQRVMAAGQLLQAFGQSEDLDYVDTADLLRRGFLGLGLPASIRSETQVSQLRDERAKREAMATGIGGAIPQAVRAAMQTQSEEK